MIRKEILSEIVYSSHNFMSENLILDNPNDLYNVTIIYEIDNKVWYGGKEVQVHIKHNERKAYHVTID